MSRSILSLFSNHTQSWQWRILKLNQFWHQIICIRVNSEQSRLPREPVACVLAAVFYGRRLLWENNETGMSYFELWAPQEPFPAPHLSSLNIHTYFIFSWLPCWISVTIFHYTAGRRAYRSHPACLPSSASSAPRYFELFVRRWFQMHLWCPIRTWHWSQRTSCHTTWQFLRPAPCLLFAYPPCHTCSPAVFSARLAAHANLPGWSSSWHCWSSPRSSSHTPEWLPELLYNTSALSSWTSPARPCPIFALLHFSRSAKLYLFWSRCLGNWTKSGVSWI